MHISVHCQYPVANQPEGVILSPILYNLDVEYKRECEYLKMKPVTTTTPDGGIQIITPGKWKYIPCQFGGVTIMRAVELGGDYAIHTFLGIAQAGENFSRRSGIFSACCKLANILYPPMPDENGNVPKVWLIGWEKVLQSGTPEKFDRTEFCGYNLVFSTVETLQSVDDKDPDYILTSLIKFHAGADGGLEAGREKLGEFWWLDNDRDHLPTNQEILDEAQQKADLKKRYMEAAKA